jgi:hypothetical protein
MAARGLGLLNAGRGDHLAAATWLDEAAVRCNRVPDRYQWIHGHVLDAMITTALDRDDHGRAAPLVATLGSLAARCDMRELLVRAHLHRHRLGDPTALASARLLGADIDNPALAVLLGTSGAVGRAIDARPAPRGNNLSQGTTTEEEPTHEWQSGHQSDHRSRGR